MGARFFADLEHIADQEEVGVLEEALESGRAKAFAQQGFGYHGPDFGATRNVGSGGLKLVGSQRPGKPAVGHGDPRVAGKFKLSLAHPAAGLALAEAVGLAVDHHYDGFGALHQAIQVVGRHRFSVLRQRKPVGLAQVKGQKARGASALGQHALVERGYDEALKIQGAGLEQAHDLQPVEGLAKKGDGRFGGERSVEAQEASDAQHFVGQHALQPFEDLQHGAGRLPLPGGARNRQPMGRALRELLNELPRVRSRPPQGRISTQQGFDLGCGPVGPARPSELELGAE